VLRVAALAILVACAAAGGACVAACSRSAARESSPGIHLNTPATGAAYVEYVGLSGKEFNALTTASVSPQQWAEILHVSVEGTEGIPVVGRLSGRRQRDSLHSDVSIRCRAHLQRLVRPGAYSRRELDSAGAAHRSVGDPASTDRCAFHPRHARVSERRCAPREPTPHVHRVLGADGTAKRHRARRFAR
jgi:hypothetical protein